MKCQAIKAINLLVNSGINKSVILLCAMFDYIFLEKVANSKSIAF